MNDELSRGACVGAEDPDLWYRQHAAAAAKRICHICPVAQACLEQALDHEEADYWQRLAHDDGRGTAIIAEGVWGGLSGPERRAVISRRVRRIRGVAA